MSPAPEVGDLGFGAKTSASRGGVGLAVPVSVRVGVPVYLPHHGGITVVNEAVAVVVKTVADLRGPRVDIYVGGVTVSVVGHPGLVTAA